MKLEASVIMPNYNSERYLAQSIDSILNQTIKNIEFIIVDDCSNDKSIEIIEKFSKLDKRIKPFFLKKKTGYSKLLNFAIKNSNSDFLARMDSDDISNHKRLEKQLDFMHNTKNFDISVCGSGIRAIDKEGKYLYKRFFPETSKKIKKLLPIQNIIVHPSTMMRKKIIQNVGGYNPNFEPAEDYDLWLRLLNLNYKFYNIRETLIDYRYHDNSVTTTRLKEQHLKSSYVKKNFLTKYKFDYILGKEIKTKNNQIEVFFRKQKKNVFYNYFLLLTRQAKISIFNIMFFKILLKCIKYDFYSTVRLIYIKIKLKF